MSHVISATVVSTTGFVAVVLKVEYDQPARVISNGGVVRGEREGHSRECSHTSGQQEGRELQLLFM